MRADKPTWPPQGYERPADYEPFPLPATRKLRTVENRPTGSYCNRCGETHISPTDFARCRQANSQREQL